MRSTCLVVLALAGVVAGCSDMAALMSPAQLFSLNTWTDVPAGQYEVRARVGEVLHLPLGPGTDRSQLGWMKVAVNWKPVGQPDFAPGDEVSSYVFRADKPGEYRVEVRREIVRRKDPDEPESEEDSKSLTDAPGPGTVFTRNADPKWPPRVWKITVTE